MATVLTVTDASFEADVLRSETTVLVDFWAPWCSPCKMLAPILEEIANEHSGRLTVAKLDVDENPTTFEGYRVRSIPTMLVFTQGEVVQTIVGVKPKDALLDELAAHLA